MHWPRRLTHEGAGRAREMEGEGECMRQDRGDSGGYSQRQLENGAHDGDN